MFPRNAWVHGSSNAASVNFQIDVWNQSIHVVGNFFQRDRRERIAVGVTASDKCLALGWSASVEVHKVTTLIVNIAAHVVCSISGVRLAVKYRSLRVLAP